MNYDGYHIGYYKIFVYAKHAKTGKWYFDYSFDSEKPYPKHDKHGWKKYISKKLKKPVRIPYFRIYF